MEFIEAPAFTQLLAEYLTMYGKDEAADLSAKEKRLLKAAVDGEKRQRARRRASRRK